MKRATRLASTLLASLAGLPLVAAAQDGDVAPGGAEACVSIEVDATRLACYDEAMQRGPADTSRADAAAAAARATMPAPSLFHRDAPAASDPAVRARIANAGKGSLLDSRWELARDSKLGVFNFRAYKPVYLFPVSWTSDTNERPFSPSHGGAPASDQSLDAIEARFQISFKTKALENVFGDNGDLWLAYTQSSRWQVFNGDQSRPFRETNYEPEVMFAVRNRYEVMGWKGRMFAVGINHHSNGRADPLSRSWNRVVFNVGLDREGWALNLRPWIRVPESGSDDDNPDIADYMGRGDLTLVRVLPSGHQFSLMLRHSLRGGDDARGAAQFDWAFPLHNAFRGHVQVFDGYGESLIDYNHRATHVGLGISLMEWF